MRLQLFQDHLAAELSNLPDIRSQEIQSYALTTAILVRTLVDRLGIGNLRIGSVHDSQRPTYSLKTILNDIIHYRAFLRGSDGSGRGCNSVSCTPPGENIARVADTYSSRQVEL